MSPQARAVAVGRLAERGLLAAIDVPPSRLDPASDAVTSKQSALWTIDHDGRHGDFYHCAALWFAPTVSPAALAAAYAEVAGGFDALARVVDDRSGQPRSRPVTPAPPTTVTVPTGAEDAAGWVRGAVAAAAGGPLEVSRQPAEVRVYALPDGSSALAVYGHDLYLDHQGLVGVLGPAVSARLTGGEPVREDVRISDVAAWQQQRLDDGVLGVAVAGRRAALADAPGCPWPTGGDRAGRRVAVGSGAALLGSGREAAARAGVSLAALTLAAWYRALTAWDPRAAAVPIGCCTTARVRPELRTTLGNLTNTVVLRPEPAWCRLPPAELLGPVHRAMTEALGSTDLPFELVYGQAPVQDEQIGVRFTFVEDDPAADEVHFGRMRSASGTRSPCSRSRCTSAAMTCTPGSTTGRPSSTTRSWTGSWISCGGSWPAPERRNNAVRGSPRGP